MDELSREISRREALKRGATVGVGVLWATPAVQAVSMMRSAAAATSPPPDDPVYFAVKIEEGGKCEDIWDQVGGTTPAKCLTPNGGALAVVPGGCDKVVDAKTPDDARWVIELAAGCVLLESSLMTKAGQDCLPANGRRDGQKWYFSNPTSNGKEISHIEFVICCERND